MQVLSKIAGVRLAVVSLAMLGVLTVVGCGGTSSTSSNVTATPAFSPGGGTYNASQSVTISGATPNSVFYCTTDGTTPTASSPQCAQPTIVFKTEFLQAIAVAPGKAASAVVSAGYTIDLNAAATPTFSPAGSTYTSAQTVTISSATNGANIYYTTDGTPPSATNGTAYAGSFPVSPAASSPTVTVKAIAVGSSYNDSAEADATITLLASPTISGRVVSGSAGSVPISGATVQLYAAGTTGYGRGTDGPTLLSTTPSTVATDASGHFAFSYSCPAATTTGGDLLYLVASSGPAGPAGQGINPGIRLMTALGSCNVLASNTSLTANGNTQVTVNEATIIASAYALSAFAVIDTINGGIDVGAPATQNTQAPTCDAKDGWLSSGKETCNYNGLKNAFAAANNLVNIGTGATLSITPAYNGSDPNNPGAPVPYLNTSTVPHLPEYPPVHSAFGWGNRHARQSEPFACDRGLRTD